jgi:hypothetical protein
MELRFGRMARTRSLFRFSGHCPRAEEEAEKEGMVSASGGG